MKLYLTGPMRGYPKFNFPAFDLYAAKLREQDHEVISPAEMDRDAGFDETKDDPGPHDFREFMKRDCNAICECEGIALMPGWENSSGVKVEITLARFLGLTEIDAETGEPLETKTICQEADELTHGQRQKDYGHAADNFLKTARLWTAYLENRELLLRKLEWFDIPRMMILFKVDRQTNRPKRDNLVDAAGYAQTEQMALEEFERREAQYLIDRGAM